MISNIRALILDMDGVLWRGPEWLIDPGKTFSRIQQAGFKIALATNNATRTIEYYLKKFSDVGVTLSPEQIMNSGAATAKELADRYPVSSEVYVVGEWGLGETLKEKGFKIGANSPVAVVCGMDRKLTYDMIATATKLINSGAAFIGTNPDKSFPTPEGLAPGAGSILAAIEAATGVSPEIIGKPRPIMYQQLLDTFDLQPEQALVVGDRLETDIAGGQALGCRTAALLSGVSTLPMIQAWNPSPDFVFPDMNALVDELVKK